MPSLETASPPTTREVPGQEVDAAVDSQEAVQPEEMADSGSPDSGVKSEDEGKAGDQGRNTNWKMFVRCDMCTYFC